MNPLLDDIQSDYEALQREKARASAARTVARVFPTPHGAAADLIPQWIPSHYELLHVAETCENCGDIRVISSGIFFVESHLKTPSTIRKTRVHPSKPDFIPGIPRKTERTFCNAPMCPDCLTDLFHGRADD